MSTAVTTLAGVLTLLSPNEKNSVEISFPENNQAQYRLVFEGRNLTEYAEIGIRVDGIDFGRNSTIVNTSRSRTEETFPTLGNHRGVSIKMETFSISLRDKQSGRPWTVEAVMTDDAFAWRYVIPPANKGQKMQKVESEASSFRPVGNPRVWVSERPNDWKLKSYAGYWASVPLNELASFSPVGPVQCPPLVAEANGGGWLLFSEAALFNYSGMRLEALKDGRLRANFTEGHKGFEIEGTITSPWRVVKYAKELIDLVNTTDLMEALSPPPSQDFSWVRPGRAAWHWWSKRRSGTPREERQMVDCASQLNFEYSLVDEGWRNWTNTWVRVKELSTYAKEKNVGIFLWSHMKDIMNPSDNYAELRAFLDDVANAGAAGVKIDFFNSESLEMIKLQEAIFREAADRKLLVVLHGCHKATGESRTWPNQLTREGIRGLELNGMKEGPITARHNCALPFTRLAVGPGDYTPIGFSNPGQTSWVHQLASAVIFLSPLQVIAEYPPMLLNDPRCEPVLDIIRDMPTAWHETRVLAPSKIGECVVLARRKNSEWWVAVINSSPKTIESLDLSFLGFGKFEVVLIDSFEQANSKTPFRRSEFGIFCSDKIGLKLKQGDGALIRISPLL